MPPAFGRFKVGQAGCATPPVDPSPYPLSTSVVGKASIAAWSVRGVPAWDAACGSHGDEAGSLRHAWLQRERARCDPQEPLYAVSCEGQCVDSEGAIRSTGVRGEDSRCQMSRSSTVMFEAIVISRSRFRTGIMPGAFPIVR
jgi:hypothetical protein